jgi:hypothetical protein
MTFMCGVSFLLALAATTIRGGLGGPTAFYSLKSCEAMLDNLDDEYNERRKIRHEKKMGSTGEKFIFDLYEPEATCFREERFGSESEERFDAHGDGPKFLCGVDLIAAKARDENAGGCLVYSVGSNNDVQFERAVHAHMGCEIHTFDPTLRRPFVGDMYSTFHPWGLGTDGGKEGASASNTDNWIRKSFETVMKDLGHMNRTIDILKVCTSYFGEFRWHTRTTHHCFYQYSRSIVKVVSLPPFHRCLN